MDDSVFLKGDLGYILVDPIVTPEHLLRYNGSEVEVVGELGRYESDCGQTVFGYLVKNDERELLVEQHELKRRPSFGDSRDVVSWADCAWKPKEMAHVQDY
jgi:hypothetical protein